MADLGELLRLTREKKGLKISDIAVETRIRGKVIRALEAGDYQQLPPEPFIRGLLKNYAQFLGLEPDLVLDAYAIETGKKPAPVSLTAPEATKSQTRSPSQKDAPTRPKPPPIFVLPPHVRKTEDRFNDKTDDRPLDLPPFLSPPSSLQDEVDATGSDSTRRKAPQAAAPIHQQVSTREVSPLFSQGSQPVFEVAPEVAPEPAAAPDPALWIHRISATKLPEAVAVFAVAVAILALAAFGYNRLMGSNSNVSQTFATVAATPKATRQQATPILPTPVPTFEATSIGGVAFSPTQTKAPSISPGPPPAVVPVDAQMEIEISATELPVWAWVVVDNVEVFKGDIQNDDKTWTAKSRLYVQVKDLPNGTVTFDGKPILARVFGERKILERAWEMNLTGTAVPSEPLPFLPTPTLTPTLTSTSVPTNTTAPTFTSTPSNTPVLTPTLSPTLAPTESPNPTVTNTATETTGAPGATLDPCAAKPGEQC